MRQRIARAFHSATRWLDLAIVPFIARRWRRHIGEAINVVVAERHRLSYNRPSGDRPASRQARLRSALPRRPSSERSGTSLCRSPRAPKPMSPCNRAGWRTPQRGLLRLSTTVASYRILPRSRISWGGCCAGAVWGAVGPPHDCNHTGLMAASREHPNGAWVGDALCVLQT